MEDIKDRIAARRAAAKATTHTETVGGPSNGPPGPSSRAQRFSAAGQTERDAQDDGVEGQMGQAQAPVQPVHSSAPVGSAPQGGANSEHTKRRSHLAAGVSARPAVSRTAGDTSSMKERLAEAAAISEQRQPTMKHQLEWFDLARPAGSAYSEEEWTAAELANPGCVVMEMLKPQDRALIAMPTPDPLPSHMADLLRRSLVIHDLVSSEWSALASAKIVHHGAFGRFTYQVVRSDRERAKNPWLDNSTMTLSDTSAPDAVEEGRVPTSRAQRYRAS
jgi:hypothetical protein